MWGTVLARKGYPCQMDDGGRRGHSHCYLAAARQFPGTVYREYGGSDGTRTRAAVSEGIMSGTGVKARFAELQLPKGAPN